MADLCTDAYRIRAGADIGLINGGGVRSSIPAGDITYGSIINVQPFGNSICVAEISGQQLLDALEMGACFYPKENGSFMQVSGLTYEIHSYVPSSVTLDENGNFTGVTGEYRVKNVLVGGEPLELSKTYTVSSIDFLLISCGGGMTMFEECNVTEKEIMLDYQAVIDYNRVGKTNIIGYYDSDTILNAVQKEIIFSTISMDTAQMGKYCVNALNDYLDEGYVSDYYTVDTYVVDQDNINEYLEGEE